MFKLHFLVFICVLLIVETWTAELCLCLRPPCTCTTPTPTPPPTTTPICPKNEEFIKCGSLCQDTCATRGQNCTRIGFTCENRCYCKKGYIRPCSEDAPCQPEDICNVVKCVPPSTPVPTTTPKCPENEEFKYCGSFCQDTCATIGQNCTRVGIQCENRCYCKKGYIRPCREDAPCEPEDICKGIRCSSPSTTVPVPTTTPKCPENEEFKYCGSFCQDTCATIGQNCTRVGIKCENRCYCKKGYIRPCREDAPCEPEDICKVVRCGCPSTPKCPENEEFKYCGSLCQDTCDTIGQRCTRTRRHGLKCENRCYCKKGYVRAFREDGPCIPIEKCDKRSCSSSSEEDWF